MSRMFSSLTFLSRRRRSTICSRVKVLPVPADASSTACWSSASSSTRRASFATVPFLALLLPMRFAGYGGTSLRLVGQTSDQKPEPAAHLVEGVAGDLRIDQGHAV